MFANSNIISHSKINKKMSYSENIKVQRSSSFVPTINQEKENSTYKTPLKKLKTEKQSFSQISCKTLNLIETLKRSKKQSILENPIIVPLLLPNSKDFPLFFQNLVEVASILDASLNMLKFQKMTPFFSEIRAQINKKYLKILIPKNLCYILGFEKLYSLMWGYNEKVCDYELYVEAITVNNGYLINSNEIKARKNILFQKINDFILQNPDFKNSNYLKENISKIAFAEFPIKPFQIKPNSVKDLSLQKSKEVFKRISVFEKLHEMGLLKSIQSSVILSPTKKRSTFEQTQNLRERILKQVKKKEEELEINKVKAVENQKNLILAEIYNFAIFLMIYYKTRNVKNMFLVKVIEFAQKNYPKIRTNEEYIEILECISIKVPEWLKIIGNPAGKIVKLSVGFNQEDIQLKLDETNIRRN